MHKAFALCTSSIHDFLRTQSFNCSFFFSILKTVNGTLYQKVTIRCAIPASKVYIPKYGSNIIPEWIDTNSRFNDYHVPNTTRSWATNVVYDPSINRRSHRHQKEDSTFSCYTKIFSFQFSLLTLINSYLTV